MKKKTRFYNILFIFPALFLFFLYTVIPIFVGFLYSFTDYDGFSEPTFVGLENYQQILTDENFYRYFAQTLIYVLFFVLFIYVASLILALILTNENIKYKRLQRTLFYLPSILSFVVVGIMWQWLLADSFSVLNQVREAIGLESIATLSDPEFAMRAVILVSVWARVGFFTVIFMGGILNIPASLKEASSIDGASKWQHFRKVTLPMLKPTSLVIIVLATIEAFKAFSLVVNLTGGGPNGSTTFIVQYIYDTGFASFDVGYASAMSFILLIVVAIFTLINFKFAGDGDL